MKEKTHRSHSAHNRFLTWFRIFNLQLLLDHHADYFDSAANCAAMVPLGRKFVKRIPHLLRVQIFVHIARHILD